MIKEEAQFKIAFGIFCIVGTCFLTVFSKEMTELNKRGPITLGLIATGTVSQFLICSYSAILSLPPYNVIY